MLNRPSQQLEWGMKKERRITIRMAADLHEELARYAIGKGVTMSRAVRGLIETQKGNSAAQFSRWLFR
jgi:hypothetical protein